MSVLRGRLVRAKRLESRPFQLLGDGAADDRTQVAVRDFGAHQCDEPLELVVKLLAGGELDLVSCGREWLDGRRPRRRPANSSREEFGSQFWASGAIRVASRIRPVSSSCDAFAAALAANSCS